MNTKSHFDWVGCRLHFTSDRRREKFFMLCFFLWLWGQGRLFQKMYILFQTVLCSVLLNKLSLQSFFLSPSLLLPSISVREWKETFGKSTSIPQRHSFMTEEAAETASLQKQASKRPNPCGLCVSVLNDENMCNFILTVVLVVFFCFLFFFKKLFWVSQWQTSQLLENY